VIQKMLWGEQEERIVRIFDYARGWQQQVAPSGKVRDIVREGTAESRRRPPIYGQGWLSNLKAVLPNSCGSSKEF
jgi:hypothetical protein